MMVEFLKKNAEAFCENAKDLFRKGILNLAAFNIEQGFQLYLKYFLAIKLGEYPKTHSLRELFKEASKLCRKLWEFYLDNTGGIGNIESAYIMSRYLPTEFTNAEVEEMMRLFEKFKEVLRSCLS